MLLMLIAVAIISGVLDIVTLRSGGMAKEGIPFKDTIAIFVIVILNGFLGEAHAVEKQATAEDLDPNTALGDRVNMVYTGTEVLQGRAKVLVTRTGIETELGKIAQMLQAVEDEATPLQQRMTRR